VRIKSIITKRFSSSYGKNKSYGQPLGIKSIVVVSVTSDNFITRSAELYSGIYIPEILGDMVDYLSKLLIGKEYNLHQLDFYSHIPFISNSGIYKSIQGAIHNCILQILFKENNLSIVDGLKSFLYFKFQRKEYDSLKYYLSGGSVAYSVQETLNDANIAILNNYEGFKMRCGLQDIEIDTNRVSEVKSILNKNINKINLMIDFIQGTLRPSFDLKRAAHNINLFKDGILWFEEPFDPDKVYVYKKLRGIISKEVPLAIGESFTSYSEYESFADLIQFFQLDVTHGGSFLDLINIINNLMDEYPKLKFTSHVWGSGLSILLNLALARATNCIEWFEIPMVEFEINNYLFPDLKMNNIRSLSNKDIDELLDSIDLSNIDNFKFVKGSGYRIS